MKNKMELIVPATSENEAFTRATVGAFAVQLDPTVEALSDIKTAVSEAVTNAIVHGYDSNPSKSVVVRCETDDDTLTVFVEDFGRGMDNCDQCQEDYYTTAEADERSGLGFTIMRSLTDSVCVSSAPGAGTLVILKKKLK